ncbi:MAG: hemerythrin domain-containing protein [Ornithinibacter sp.]
MCSYCGCENIEVVGRFMAEHVEIINASDLLRRACEAGDAALVAGTATHLSRLMRPHTTAEEVGIFTVLAEDEEFTAHVRSLCEEHIDLDERLEAIATGDHGSFAAFDRALRVHIDREENGLFPAAAIAFAGVEWQRVADLTPDAVLEGA